jgi:hypothetical protein
MARYSAQTYRLRRFRVALIVVIALPWFVDVLLAPFFAWHMSVLRTAILLAVDGLLAFGAWRNPAGLATILIIVRLALDAALWLVWGKGVGLVYGVVLALGALLLVVLVVPMWLPLRKARWQAKLAGVDAMTSGPDRSALKRSARIEEQGYL